MRLRPKPGIHFDVPFAEYHDWDAVSSHFLWTLKTKSPCHAKYEREHGKDPVPCLVFGQAAHVLVLEPDQFTARYAVGPEARGNSRAWKEAEEEAKAQGKLLLKPKDYEGLLDLRNAFKASRAARYVQQGRAEVSMVWPDAETGLLCKARMDYLREVNAVFLDLKTDRDVHPMRFPTHCAQLGYHHQGAMYSDGYQTLTGDRPAYVIVTVETEPPFVVKPYEPDDLAMQAGHNSYRKALERCAECMTSGVWPAYGDDVELLSLPDWALRREGVGPYQVTTY